MAPPKETRESGGLHPPLEVEEDPDRYRNWLLSLPDETLRGIVGTRVLNAMVVDAFQKLRRRYPDRNDSEAARFLTRLNERIIAVRGRSPDRR